MYLSTIESNRNTIGSPVTEFSERYVTDNEVAGLCGDWRFREIVNLVVAAINGGGNAVH